MIERIHLRILKAVETEGSLTAAAKSLYLTQSALSHTIKKLEHQLGTPLWVKEGRTLKLTQAGAYLQREATRVLPQLERIDEVLNQFASGEKGTLRIGMECYPCYHWLQQVIKPFLLQWPGVDIDINQRFKFGGVAALFNNEVDILITPDPVYASGITHLPVFLYEQVLVVASEHPLAGRDFITPQALTSETLYTYPIEATRLDVFQQFLLPAGCQPKRHKTIEDTDMLLQMVAAGRGVTTLPLWLVDDYQNTLNIEAVRLGEHGVSKQINIVVRDSSVNDQHIQAFVASAKAAS
ncbi:LysR family transcriptional regulator [Vibrio hippocampi]|uniref:HTH-type transcriptional regulator MetR n=1 Tax=Vibrio hippocampi TaxID=654686 RepID=A0ABM8ZNT0_9VIBR|nr:LysR family transcriptional regulator [Vibrio hippocampi]CAH0530326.1 HTH-type transcriptional regulator MetR [Vibrio hippocampi]